MPSLDAVSLRQLAEIYDQWQATLAMPEPSRQASQDRIRFEVEAHGPEFARAFANMLSTANTDGGASVLPSIPDAMRSAAIAQSQSLLSTGQAAQSESNRLERSPPQRQPGQQVGPYRLIRELGRGGMGVVWLAARADGQHERQVALKMPLVENLNWLLAARFARERNILASLEHPGIARLYDAGVDSETQPYIALEYVVGQSINDYVRDQQLKPEATVALFTKEIGRASCRERVLMPV